MAKPVQPPGPSADAIPAEFLLGREEPDVEEPDPIEPAPVPPPTPPRGQRAGATSKRAPMSRGDRAFVAGLIGVLIIGGGLYLFRSDIAMQYELRVHPERYWSSEVKRRAFHVELAELEHQGCMVDLLAARMKESINVARSELMGVSSSDARAWATNETAAQEQLCDVLADLRARDRSDLTEAERELGRVGSR